MDILKLKNKNMEKEKYQPTPEEMKKAEDMMSETESTATKIKGYDSDVWERFGHHGELRLIEVISGPSNSVHTSSVKGQIDGHEVIFEKCTYPSTYPSDNSNRIETDYSGLIDNMEISSKIAEELFYKYRDAASIRNDKVIAEKHATEDLKDRLKQQNTEEEQMQEANKIAEKLLK
jgi:hypothetical protein